MLVQKQLLEEQADNLQQTQDAITVVLEQCKSNTSKTFDWNNLITLIERYRMTQNIKKIYGKDISEDGLNKYLAIKKEYSKKILMVILKVKLAKNLLRNGGKLFLIIVLVVGQRIFTLA